MAEKYGSTVYVLHVIDIDHFEEASLFESRPFIPPEEIEEGIVEEGMKKIENFISKNFKNKKRLGIVKLIKRGKLFTEIIATAREKEIDLIVMGTHGRTGISHALMGSVAEKVARIAPFPVLPVRSRNFRFEAP